MANEQRLRLAVTLTFGIFTLVVMLMYAGNAVTFSTLDSISRELNNPISLLMSENTEPEVYSPLSGNEEIVDEMHEYYYVPGDEENYDDVDDDGFWGAPDPNEYNMDYYDPVEGDETIKDDLGDNYYMQDDNDDIAPVDPDDLGLLEDYGNDDKEAPAENAGSPQGR